VSRWLCPLSFGRRGCKFPCGLRRMLVLLGWPCLFWLLAWVLCTGAWPGVVSLPSGIMWLSFGHFPGGLPVGSRPSLLGPSVSPAGKNPSGMFGIFPTPSAPVWFWASGKSPALLDFPEVNGRTRLLRPERRSPLPMFPAPWLRLLQRLDTLAALCGDEVFLTAPSPTRFLRFPRGNWPFPILSAGDCLGFTATVAAFYCPDAYAG